MFHNTHTMKYTAGVASASNSNPRSNPCSIPQPHVTLRRECQAWFRPARRAESVRLQEDTCAGKDGVDNL
jgi:hypothetical protein